MNASVFFNMKTKNSHKQKLSFHWADVVANRIISQRGEKEVYTLASGITPSGIIHIGNFRELITVDFIKKALEERGKKTRFLFFWDNLDAFRKVPGNMPHQKTLEKHLRKPLCYVPSVFDGEVKTYAEFNMKVFEKALEKVDVKPEFVYQASEYENGKYASRIKEALKQKEKIATLLNEHRSTPLPEDWWPVSVFCEKCLKDNVVVKDYDNKSTLKIFCDDCEEESEVDFEKKGNVKLLWRIDWPARWKTWENLGDKVKGISPKTIKILIAVP